MTDRDHAVNIAEGLLAVLETVGVQASVWSEQVGDKLHAAREAIEAWKKSSSHASRGGTATARNRTKAERSAAARKAVTARWKAWRRAKRRVDRDIKP